MDPAPEQPAEQPAPSPSERHFNESRREASLKALGAFDAPKPVVPPTEPAPPVVAPPAAPVVPPVAAPPADDLAALRKQEIHQRRQLAEREEQWRAEQARKEAEIQPRLSKLEQYEASLAAAKDDPIAYLKAAGYTEADFDSLARRVYAHSPEAAKDPKTKQAAEAAAYQTKAQREALAEAKAAREEAASVRKLLEDRDQQAQMQDRERAHRAQIVKAAGDASPLARARLQDERAGDSTWQRMKELIVRMHTESSPYADLREVPAPEAILKAYEQERRAELETDLRALGFDPALLNQPGAPVPPATPAAPRSPTLAPNVGTPTTTPPKGRLSREQLIKEATRLAEIAKP